MSNPPSTLFNRAALVLASLLGLMFLGNGSFMLVAPESWYWSVETVPETGPFNQHFVRDIALMYLLCGVAAIGGVLDAGRRFGWWIAAAAWQIAHGGLHTFEVVTGICTPAAYAQDFVPVVIPGLLLAAMAWPYRE